MALTDDRTIKAGDKGRDFYWAKAIIPPARDLAALRPAELPKGQRFETAADATAYSEQLERSLRHGNGDSDRVEVLKDCRAGHYPCGKPFCPLCARLFRRWLFGESSRIVSERDAPAAIITAFFETRDPGLLGSADPRMFKDQLRNQMNRAGFGAAVALGGIEANYKGGRWVLHGHVLTIGANEAALGHLRRFYKDIEDVARPLVIQPVEDPVKQRSYLLKFHSYTRPTKSGKAVPLKPATAQELVHWLDGYSFEDFVFLRGLRRRGTELRPS